MQAAVLLCSIALVGAMLMAAFALARRKITADAEEVRRTTEAELETAKLFAATQIEAAKGNTNGLLEAAKVANMYGFALIRPDEAPAQAARQGFVVFAPDAWRGLLDAITARTNTSGEANRLLRSAGLLDRPESKATWSDTHPENEP